jgi:hypothetical protein
MPCSASLLNVQKLQLMGRLLLILLFWLAALNALMSQITANAALTPARVETGDTFSLKVLVSGTNVEPGEVNFGSWLGIAGAPTPLSHTGWKRSGQQWVQQFVLIAFDSAALNLPPLTVRSHLGDSVHTNPLQLNVRPTPSSTDLSDMETVRDIQREPEDWTDYWPVAVIALLLLIAARWYLKRKQKPKPIVVRPVPEPVQVVEPWSQQTLRKLKTLEHQKPWKNGHIAAYYAELSMIVREYIEHQFQIPAMESTTTEILRFLKPTAFPAPLQPILKEMLRQADLAKYAQSNPPDSFHEKAIQQAVLLVHETSTLQHPKAN